MCVYVVVRPFPAAAAAAVVVVVRWCRCRGGLMRGESEPTTTPRYFLSVETLLGDLCALFFHSTYYCLNFAVQPSGFPHVLKKLHQTTGFTEFLLFEQSLGKGLNNLDETRNNYPLVIYTVLSLMVQC